MSLAILLLLAAPLARAQYVWIVDQGIEQLPDRPPPPTARRPATTAKYLQIANNVPGKVAVSAPLPYDIAINHHPERYHG
jgi:hypothetical protein